jgi:hypothetical protein
MARGIVDGSEYADPVAWNVDPWPSSRGVVHVRVRSDAGADTPRATIDLRADGIALQNTDVTVPAAAIASAWGTWPQARRGEVNASASNLRLTPARTAARRGSSGTTRASARRNSDPIELGEVRAGLVANGATMSGPGRWPGRKSRASRRLDSQGKGRTSRSRCA